MTLLTLAVLCISLPEIIDHNSFALARSHVSCPFGAVSPLSSMDSVVHIVECDTNSVSHTLVNFNPTYAVFLHDTVSGIFSYQVCRLPSSIVLQVSSKPLSCHRGQVFCPRLCLQKLGSGVVYRRLCYRFSSCQDASSMQF